MPAVLHILPHPGGGAETYIDALAGTEGFSHERIALSDTRSRLRGLASVSRRWPRVRARARWADIVHAHGDTAAVLAIPLLRRRPSVITAQGLHRLHRSGGALGAPSRAAIRAAVAAAAVTICSSSGERDELARLVGGALARRLVTIPNGIPLPPPRDPATRARVRAELGLGEEDVVALFAGRLEERKDPLLAIEAASRARREGIPLVMLVAGAGPLATAVAERASDAIRVLGFRSDTADLFAAADMFVLPSRREGMSFAVLEAMANGLPAIVADEPGNVEAVGGAGVVAPGGVEPLAGQLAALARDPTARARLGAAARERIATELTDSRFRARTREAYERALQRRGLTRGLEMTRAPDRGGGGGPASGAAG